MSAYTPTESETGPKPGDVRFEEQMLFGGAMLVKLPENYYDVSDVRQVPDTQEVFQEREGLHNVIVDVLEYVEHLDDSHEAARYHLEDYVDGDGDLKVWKLESINLPHLPQDLQVVSLLATTPPKDDVLNAIFMLVVRLDKHATDLVITTNLHHVYTGDARDYDALFQGDAHPDFKIGKDIAQQVVDSFKIKDYGLFHPGTS